MEPEGIVIVIAACSAFVASVIVSFRNVRESECRWDGCMCTQDPSTDEERPPSVSEV